MGESRVTEKGLEQLINCETLARDNAQFVGCDIDFAYHRDTVLALTELRELRTAKLADATCPKCSGSGMDDFFKDGKCVMCCGTGGGGLR